MRILLHYRDHPALRKMSRIATVDAPQPMPVMILFTVLHVATGALTLAASIVAVIEVYRNVRPEHRFAPHSVAVTS